MTQNEIKETISSVVKNIINQKVYSLVNDLDDNEFTDRVVDESYDSEVFVEDHYEVNSNGDIIDMENPKVKEFINYLTETWVSRVKINETPKHMWGVN